MLHKINSLFSESPRSNYFSTEQIRVLLVHCRKAMHLAKVYRTKNIWLNYWQSIKIIILTISRW